MIKWNEMSAKNVYDLHRALLGLYPLTATFQDTKIKLRDVRNIGEPVAAILKVEAPGKYMILYIISECSKILRTNCLRVFFSKKVPFQVSRYMIKKARL